MTSERKRRHAAELKNGSYQGNLMRLRERVKEINNATP